MAKRDRRSESAKALDFCEEFAKDTQLVEAFDALLTATIKKAVGTDHEGSEHALLRDYAQYRLTLYGEQRFAKRIAETEERIRQLQEVSDAA